VPAHGAQITPATASRIAVQQRQPACGRARKGGQCRQCERSEHCARDHTAGGRQQPTSARPQQGDRSLGGHTGAGSEGRGGGQSRAVAARAARPRGGRQRSGPGQIRRAATQWAAEAQRATRQRAKHDELDHLSATPGAPAGPLEAGTCALILLL
jgi:hypothetical protein